MFTHTSMMFMRIFLLFVVCPAAWGLAVMSIDFGSEWMKVAIVSPGVPMEIALNRESQRKTPIAVSFRDGERVFGDPALTIGVRFPDKAYIYLLNIIGKKIDNPVVDLYKKKFPYYNIKASEDGQSLIFIHPDGAEFSVEELVAMLLKQAQDIAEKAAGQPIKDAVITVPPFFTQCERRAMLQAAKLSGLNVLQLINSNTAVALNYGIFRRKDFNESATNIMFYDMGAGSTVATIVTYQLMKFKETGEINPQLTVKGVGFDQTLGGLEMQLRLRDYLAKKFNEAKKTNSDVFKSNRAMAKLFKEAGRVKKVLSANTEFFAQVESLLDDQDFKYPMIRAEFEELCSDLFKRVTHPVEEALKSAQMTLDHIDQIILSGSGTRVPKVQQILLEYVKKEDLGKSLNTDESAALGAAYQAAHLSKGFKVKTFLIKDANIYPIQVDFQREYELEDKSIGIKTVKRTLFGRNNGIPLKKIMTFNRHVKDFEFFVNYGELGFLSDFELQSLGSLNITRVSLLGVEDAISKHMGEKTEYRGVKAHFRMDESGILNLDEVLGAFSKPREESASCHHESVLTKFTNIINGLHLGSSKEPKIESESKSESIKAENAKEEKLEVESVFEKPEEESAESKLESAFAKLGNTIGRLFSGSSEETVSKESEKEPKVGDSKKVKEEKPEESKSENKTKSPEKKNETELKKEVKLLTVKEPIISNIVFLDLPLLSDSNFKTSVKKLKDLDEHDRARLAKAKAKNSLESFIIETREKLYTDEYEIASTDEERSNIQKTLSEMSEWLEYESDNATTEVFKNKLLELKKLTQDLFERVKEHRDRPEAIKALNDMINISSIFLSSASNMSEDDQIFTEVELKTLGDLITDTKKWIENSVNEQNTIPMNSAPKMTLKLIAEKMSTLDREVKYLLNKARFAQPLKKKAEKEMEKEAKINASTQNTTEQPDNKTDESDKETVQGTIPPLDIPELEQTENTETTSGDTVTPQPETPSPDKVQDEKHSEL